MATKTAFDNQKYINEQKAEILERVQKFDNKLYRNLAEDHGRKPVGESVPLKKMKEIV